MKRIQTLFIILSCVFFVLTIYGLTHFSLYLILLLLILHSICLMLVAYTAAGSAADEQEVEKLKKELADQALSHENEVEKLTQSLKTHEQELMRIAGLKEQAEQRLKDSEESLEGMTQELEEARHRLEADRSLEEQDRLNSLLPPAGDADDATINIIAVAQAAVDELQSSARKANLTVRISSALKELLVKANPERIRILFKNIIDNSVKYMNQAGSLIITISTIENDIFIVLKDTGNGLPQEETRHIFELNFQGSNRISGNGLGLAQARAIVEYYGGTIYAKSDSGKGMAIYIQLPAT